MSKWNKSPESLKRAPGCECTQVYGGLSLVLAMDGAPKGSLPGMMCNCGRTLVCERTKKTFHLK